MSVELRDFRPDSQVWGTYFDQCVALGRTEQASALFDPYVDALIGEFESYFDEYDRISRASSGIMAKKEQIEADFTEIYTRYSTAHSSEYDALERKMESLEANYEKLIKEEEKLEQSMTDLEDRIYNCLYLFEDAIALCEAYGSDKADGMKALLEAVYGE